MYKLFHLSIPVIIFIHVLCIMYSTPQPTVLLLQKGLVPKIFKATLPCLKKCEGLQINNKDTRTVCWEGSQFENLLAFGGNN